MREEKLQLSGKHAFFSSRKWAPHAQSSQQYKGEMIMDKLHMRGCQDNKNDNNTENKESRFLFNFDIRTIKRHLKSTARRQRCMSRIKKGYKTHVRCVQDFLFIRRTFYFRLCLEPLRNLFRLFQNTVDEFLKSRLSKYLQLFKTKRQFL